MSLIALMDRYFERLLAACRETEAGLPRAPLNEKAVPSIYVGEPDEERIVCWKPVPKTARTDFTEVEAAFGIRLHHSIVEYFHAFWFAALGGHIGETGVELQRVLPGREINSFVFDLAGYREAHGRKLNQIPIGIEKNGLLVVVDNATGQVLLEDFEAETFEAIAPSLSELIDRLLL